jgi:hypothetical protein
LTPSALRHFGKESILRPEFQSILPAGRKFLLEIEQLCTTLASNVARIRRAVQLPSMDDDALDHLQKKAMSSSWEESQPPHLWDTKVKVETTPVAAVLSQPVTDMRHDDDLFKT